MSQPIPVETRRPPSSLAASMGSSSVFMGASIITEEEVIPVMAVEPKKELFTVTRHHSYYAQTTSCPAAKTVDKKVVIKDCETGQAIVLRDYEHAQMFMRVMTDCAVFFSSS